MRPQKNRQGDCLIAQDGSAKIGEVRLSASFAELPLRTVDSPITEAYAFSSFRRGARCRSGWQRNGEEKMRGTLLRQTSMPPDPSPLRPQSLTPLESLLTKSHSAISFRMNTYENDGVGVWTAKIRALARSGADEQSEALFVKRFKDAKFALGGNYKTPSPVGDALCAKDVFDSRY